MSSETSNPVHHKRRGQKRKELHDYDPPEEIGTSSRIQLEEHVAYSFHDAQQTTSYLRVPVSPTKKSTHESSENIDHGDPFDSNFSAIGIETGHGGGVGGEEDDEEDVVTDPRSRRVADNPLLGFIPLIDLTIGEMLRHEALADQACSDARSRLESWSEVRGEKE
ncbi:hypothetical protein BKA70DRAFT_1233617 [Coprinopsis sp. MPI-PUGE-AT-0042]|nr:hypothetical protein BKA70DRAFT_1233617 [Coprinopsis sp. MPI-PUGE-AT-0042]